MVLFAILASVIVDSDMTQAQSLENKGFPASIVQQQQTITVRYYGFDGKLHQGQITINKSLAKEVQSIFKDIEASKFPIKKVVPIVKYNWSDSKSIADNNTSGFNYRVVDGSTKLSEHAYGRAIDVNPYTNPYVFPGRKTRPYNPNSPGTITRTSPVFKAFSKRGWQWGGDWKNAKDYQHFYKRLP